MLKSFPFPVAMLFWAGVVSAAVSAQGDGQPQKDSVVSASANGAHRDTLEARLLFEQGREYWFAREFDDAGKRLQDHIRLAERIGFRQHLADAYNLLANVYIKQEHFVNAFEALQKASEQHSADYAPLIDETYSKLYFLLGDYQTSLEYAFKAADGYERSAIPGFKLQSVFAYLMIGDIFNRMEQREKAYEYYVKAYTRGKADRDRNWYIKTPIQKIAEYHLRNGEYARARHLYDTIISIDRDAPSLEPTMFSYEGLGNIAMREKKYREAIAHYRKSLGYAMTKKLTTSIETFQTRLAGAYLANGLLDSADHYLAKSIGTSLRTRNYTNLSEAYLHLSASYRARGKYAEALSAFEQHKYFHDSTINSEKIRAVNNLEVLYRTRQHANQILTLEKAQQEKDFAIENRNISIAIGIGLVIALAVLLLLAQRNYRHKQALQEQRLQELERHQQLLAMQAMINGQEAERSRMAKDLHDGLGGLFSTVKMYFSTLEHENDRLRNDDLFRKSYALVDSASVEIRRIAHNMMPEVLMRMGLVNAVKDLSDQISAGKAMKVSLEVHGMYKRLEPGVEVMLYRIIQELVNNALRHSGATEVIIQIIRDQDRLSLVVEDNGKGFRENVNGDEGHMAGMATVRSRVNYLNGKLTVDSQENVGTSVMMDFTVKENIEV